MNDTIDIPGEPVQGHGLKPITTAPKDRFILVAGPSGYVATPLRFEVCKWVENDNGGYWQNHAGDWFMEGGEAPTHWCEIPKI